MTGWYTSGPDDIITWINNSFVVMVLSIEVLIP